MPLRQSDSNTRPVMSAHVGSSIALWSAKGTLFRMLQLLSTSNAAHPPSEDCIPSNHGTSVLPLRPGRGRQREVVLLGAQGGERITVGEWAERLGTIPYEVLCGIGPRVPRRTIGDAPLPSRAPRRRWWSRSAAGGGDGDEA